MEYNKNVDLSEWTMEFDKARTAVHQLFAISKDNWEEICDNYPDIQCDFEETFDLEEQKKIIGELKEISAANIESPLGFIPGKKVSIKKDGELQGSFFHQPLWKYPIGPREEYWTIDGGYEIEKKTDNLKMFIHNIAKWDKDETESNKIKDFIEKNKNLILVDVVSSCSYANEYKLNFTLPKDKIVEMKDFSFSFIDVPADYPMHKEIRYENQVLKNTDENFEISYRNLFLINMEEK